ncbi:histidyl-tRNA synthetase [Arboricoccus pini]|uniref:Histidine--tRNA ligase n=1 Tax=Arboricoccus pini TaxID=1963835 RepID=A0A212QZZ1_9PROT|nr:histidyl-tRNA synthetase [Arboricoccus pini]
MTQLRPVRGTHDLLGEELRRHRKVAKEAQSTAALYGFEEIATPIFEFVDVFKRTLGDVSDVVTKEMYAFTDRGGESLVLRPENTAAVVRAMLTNGLTQTLPQKLFYYGPMFRYERPQKGRQRQFHQIGVELIGAPEPEADIECIALGHHILTRLGLGDVVSLELNTLGNPESRKAYRTALVSYLSGFKDKLSSESLERLERNPLRILDSKDPEDRQIVDGAPIVLDYLNPESRSFFEKVKEGLHQLGLPYTLNPRLVRGLDYYNHTAFEFVTSALGSQGTVMGGGRYDGLMRVMGGPDIPGVGWAAGVERLAMLLADVAAATRPVALIPIGERAEGAASVVAAELRHAGIAVELAYKGKPAARLKKADKANAGIAIFLGDDELDKNVARLKNLDDGVEEEMALSQLVEQLLARGLGSLDRSSP